MRKRAQNRVLDKPLRNALPAKEYSLREKNSPSFVFATSHDFSQRESTGRVKIEQQVTACVEEWHEPVYLYLVAGFGHPAQADEITQETFLKLYCTLRQGETIANTRAWVSPRGCCRWMAN
jgi:hypothetical protein